MPKESLYKHQPVSKKSVFSDVPPISLSISVRLINHHIMFLSERTYHKAQTVSPTVKTLSLVKISSFNEMCEITYNVD
jgi:hypothetical protein